MKKIILTSVTALMLTAPIMSYAADDIHNMNIETSMKAMSADVKERIGDVKFKFGTGTGSTSGTEVFSNKRSNGTFKDVGESCNRAFYSDLIKMANEARESNKTEVVNVVSNWKGVPTSSTTTFVCADGLWMSGVALKGNLA